MLIIRACFAYHRLHTRTLSNLKLFLTCLNILRQSILNIMGFSIDINLFNPYNQVKMLLLCNLNTLECPKNENKMRFEDSEILLVLSHRFSLRITHPNCHILIILRLTRVSKWIDLCKQENAVLHCALILLTTLAAKKNPSFYWRIVVISSEIIHPKVHVPVWQRVLLFCTQINESPADLHQ